jgi:hypothetical protein
MTSEVERKVCSTRIASSFNSSKLKAMVYKRNTQHGWAKPKWVDGRADVSNGKRVDFPRCGTR